MQTSQPICARPGCAIPGRHLDDCQTRYDQDDATRCRGCLPALAATGVLLCERDTTRIGSNALNLAIRHRDLGYVLTGSSTVLAEYVTSAGADPNLKLNYLATEARADIRALLRHLTHQIAANRGFTPPAADNIHLMAQFVARADTWLAAQPKAVEIFTNLDELARRAYGIAYPAGVRIFPVKAGRDLAQCPEKVVDADGAEQLCGGTLWTILRPKDALALPGEIACNGERVTHRWPTRQWLKLGAIIQAQAKAGAEVSASEKELAA